MLKNTSKKYRSLRCQERVRGGWLLPWVRVGLLSNREIRVGAGAAYRELPISFFKGVIDV